MKVQFFPTKLLPPTKIHLLSMEPWVLTKIQQNLSIESLALTKI